jgi:tRNA dimethylallyltransferase
MRAVGYRQAWQHLDGDADADTFRAQSIAATRQLAKRQITWLRAQADARWFDPASDRAGLAQALRMFVTCR